jgi:hypothetical protein
MLYIRNFVFAAQTKYDIFSFWIERKPVVSLVVERRFQFRLLAVFHRSFNTKLSPSPNSVAVVEENDVPID